MTGPTLRRYRATDADWIVERHATLYREEAGFDDSFGRLVRKVLSDFDARCDPRIARGWIAQNGADRLGCIFFARLDAESAQLRLFLVDPPARGAGLGCRLLDACLDHARGCGFRRLRLWTHESHRAACALYQRRGFACIASKPVHSFGVDLVEQSWEIDL